MTTTAAAERVGVPGPRPFRLIPLRTLASWVFGDLDRGRTVLGIPAANLGVPGPRLSSTLLGRELAAPLGVAAGPHTQLAQNIVAAWLCGARFIELKTVQILDRIEVSRPCIDSADETYNCEWSQELTLEESSEEYLKAWVLIHALAHRLGLPGPGAQFAMSVGYDLAGVQEPRVQAFIASLRDAGPALEAAAAEVAHVYPPARDLDIPRTVSELVTLSTMHGCPPAEIERIALHLLVDLGLHTWVKVNPTLLGPERVRGLLNDTLGYDITVPDEAFAHDPAFEDAMAMVRRVAAAVAGRPPRFGLKLSNTLEVVNHRDVFPATETTMYLSGKALHPITLTLAHRVTEELAGEIPLSFCGGVDALSFPDVVADGLAPVTVCTDLLKPGGFARLQQYLRNLEGALDRVGAESLAEYVGGAAGGRGSRAVLAEHAARVLTETRYAPTPRPRSFKGARALERFDCITAPCLEDCPVHQNVPDYLWAVAHGRPTLALEVIERTNPVPGVTGRVCDHPCTDRCVRTLYDDPLAIREIKRYAVEHGRPAAPVATEAAGRAPGAARVAVVGGGPAGIAAAVHLARMGLAPEVFEARGGLGGMTHGYLPSYRMGEEVLDEDLARVHELGVPVHLGQALGREVTLAGLRRDFDYVFVGVGAQRSRRLGVPGEEAEGVVDALGFLGQVDHWTGSLGRRVLVVGGGNTAIDAARSAHRLDPGADVVLVYRRTRAEMPAEPDEVRALVEEGIAIRELLAPLRVEVEDGRVRALICRPVRLGSPDASGRPRPEAVPGAETRLGADSVVVAVGQELAPDLWPEEDLARTPSGGLVVDPATGETSLPEVYAGGDAVRGAASVVRALGDGLRAARAIGARHGLAPVEEPLLDKARTPAELLARKAERVAGVLVPELPVAGRTGFEEVVLGLDETAARAEAARCLDCDDLCSLCVTVCPNRAHQAYGVPTAPLELPVLGVVAGELGRTGTRTFAAHQAVQTLVLADACNDCGNCVPFCPSAGSPFLDKPRVWLDADGFAADPRDAYRFSRTDDGGLLLQAHLAGQSHELRWGDGAASYRSPQLEAQLDPVTGDLLDWQGRTPLADGQVLDLDPLATLLVLRHAVADIGALSASLAGAGSP